jgi:Transposase DDE domain
VTNWAAYDIALRQRGSLTVWFTEAAIAAWKAEPRRTPGGQPRYSALAITTALTLRAVFRLALRQTEGLIASLLQLLGLDLAAPDHSTLSRRGETLPVSRPRPGSEPVHLLVDSTGLKLCGPGEWLVEKHAARVRRSWRKLHIGVDADTGEIIAAELTGKDVDDGSQVGALLEQIAGPVASFTGDGAYDRDDVYREVDQRHPDAAAPFERGAECYGGDRADQARPASAADRRARSRGLAAGIWLQLARPGGGRYRPLQASDR